MTESKAHKTIKVSAAGQSGKTEVRLRSGRVLDAATKVRAIEVERGGNAGNLRKAAERLKESGKPQRVLIVPQRDLDKAAKVMREAGVPGTIKNLSGTKHTYVGVKSRIPAYKPLRGYPQAMSPIS
ncbi:MAG: hypothetical protein Q8O86_11535 [Dehalococcoidia bacterium]|nr:hypothetical protein [Dehalococcoidia bacterium]